MQSQFESDFKMGSVYYKKLKDLCRPNSSPLSLLKVKDQKLAVGDGLMKAMVATKAPVPNRSPMVDYLNSCVALPNHIEIVGILRCACELKPGIASTQLPVALDMCKFMAEHDLKKHFPDEIGIMLPWIDATLVQAYLQVKKSSLRLSSFIGLHKNTLGQVLVMGLATKLLEAKGSWLDTSDALNSAAASSKVGHKMLSFACESVLAGEVAQLIDKITGKLKEPCTASFPIPITNDIKVV